MSAPDQLYNWSSLRSEYLAEANNQIAGEYVAAGYYPGWYWNPFGWGYTFIGPGSFYSPFGWGFYPFGWGGFTVDGMAAADGMAARRIVMAGIMPLHMQAA